MHQPDRRRFLTWASAAGAFFAAHGCSAAAEPMPTREARGEPLIRHLELLSSAPLADLKAFYHESLGLGVAEEKPGQLTVEAGRTRLTFRKAPTGDEKPFYHFAFNIPENKVAAARDWQAKRTPLLPIPKTLRDPKYPDDVVHYLGRLRFIDEVVSVDGPSITCTTRIRDEHILLDGGRITPLIAVELFAQAAAALMVCHSGQEGSGMTMGYLLGTRRLDVTADSFEVGDELTTRCEEVWSADGLSQLECTVERRGEIVARGSVNVARG